MVAKILTEMSVGLTPEIDAALEIAADFSGLRPSQFARQAVIEKLVREGYLETPRHRGIQKRRAETGCRIIIYRSSHCV